MTELQNKLFELLKEIDLICRRHDIKYILFAGTGLGGQRHKGFIPWDDDADIVMTQENYEKFISVAEKEMGENRCLNYLEKNPESYLFPYARYVNTETAAIQRHTAFGGCDPGIKIDIFYMVPTFDNEEKAERHRMEILAFSEIIDETAVANRNRPLEFYEVYEAHRKIYNRIGREQYVKKYLKKLRPKHFTSKNKCVLFSGVMCNSYILDKRIFENIEYVDFEDTQLPISKYNAELSKAMYGAGWAYIPDDIFNSRHTLLLDTQRSYRDYLNCIRRDSFFSKSEAMIKKRKQMIIHDNSHFRDVLENKRKKRNILVQTSTEYFYENRENNSYKTLEDIFSTYYKEQLSPRNRNYGLTVNINKEAFLDAMRNLIITGRFYEAKAILDMNRSNEFYDSIRCEIDSLMNQTDYCYRLVESIYVKKDYSEALEIISSIPENLEECITVLTAKYYLKICLEKDDFSGIIQKIDFYAKLFSCPGDLMFLKGLIFSKQDNIELAESVWNEAMKTSTNAYFVQYMFERGIKLENKIPFSRKALGTLKSYEETVRKKYRRAVKEAGLDSDEIRKRSDNYKKWTEEDKKPVIEMYNQYEEKLLNYRAD